ncbi:MAG TPA: MFS transporter [Terriglobales bacterium]|nr:MFS transporter [Terriglobales bacterium]
MKSRRYLLGLVFLTFFMISLLTNILGPMVPDIVSAFHLSLAAAGFLVFSFFIAYGVVSIPAGFMVERFGEKTAIVLAWVAAAVGSVSFALFPRYQVAIASLFAIGAGMTILQVAINPLLRVTGGEENYAFNSALAQLVFGSASFLSPRVYTYLVLNLKSSVSPNQLLSLLKRLTPASLPWVSIYWVFGAATVFMLAILAVTRFPRVQRTEEESAGSWEIYRNLARKPTVQLYFLAMFAYVGCEQGTANWISKFLFQYHGFDPHTTGAIAVSEFWGLMTVGCFVGMLLLKIFDSRKVLIGASVCALGSLSVALFGSAPLARWAFPVIGLFASVMWPIIVSLALNSVAEHHGAFSGILSTAVIGGAIVPLIIGRIGDHTGLRAGMAFLYLTFGFVMSIGFWARPLISNATISLRKSESSSSPDLAVKSSGHNL